MLLFAQPFGMVFTTQAKDSLWLLGLGALGPRVKRNVVRGRADQPFPSLLYQRVLIRIHEVLQAVV